ncbi:MAG: TIGR02206 family membrane protein [Calditrichaeota bacterium]|nr:MAG: TIGR02206 family membrane protein [Calditrichota bacterium]
MTVAELIPFKLFGPSHIFALLVIGFFSTLALKTLQKYSRLQLRIKFHPFLGWLLITWVIFYKTVLLLTHDFSIREDLPFHLCSISTLAFGFYFLKPDRKLYDIIFYWGFSGATLGLIFPDLKVGFPSFRYFAMFFGHGIMLFAILYLLVFFDLQPRGKGKDAFIYMNLLAVLLIPINLITGGNYLFLRQIPIIDFAPAKILPGWPWHIPILELFAWVYFRFIDLLAGWIRAYSRAQLSPMSAS